MCAYKQPLNDKFITLPEMKRERSKQSVLKEMGEKDIDLTNARRVPDEQWLGEGQQINEVKV